jgi:N-acetylglucosaminyldiphosphoundecaprenol N-acetyl-beta-D-mannosaminyltransferase
MKTAELIRRRKTRVGTVRGPSLFELTLDLGRSSGVKHFLVGSTPETLKRLTDEVNHRYPGVLIAGTYSPPFCELSDNYILGIVEAMDEELPDIIWVGLGTPKQDLVAVSLSQSISSTVIGVGAAFDFVAGTVREAPRWLQNTGFEWVFRLICEPRRLWRRYLFGNLGFILAVVGGLFWGSTRLKVDS